MTDIALAHATSPRVSAYPWSSGGGFGAKFANPGTLPAGTGRGVSYSEADDFVAVGHDGSPFISIYPWSGAGFGAKFANPGTLPAGNGDDVDFTTADDAVVLAHATTPFVSAYPWSGAGFGAKFANPGTLPAGTGRGSTFTTADDALAIGHTTTPFISAYPWSGAGFGAKFANPGTLPGTIGRGVDFTTADDALAIARNSTPFVAVYPWSGAGFGVIFANPGTLPTGAGNDVDFTAADDALNVAHGTTPFTSSYPWSGAGFGAKFANPGTLPAANSNGTEFTSSGDAVAVGVAATPWVAAYPWSGAGFGAKFADPVSSLPQAVNSVAYTHAPPPPPPPTLPASEPEFVLLDNAERRAQEDAFVVVQEAAQVQLKAVFISAIDPVANVALNIVGGDCDHDPTQLPGLRLTWDQVVPLSGTSFIAYGIMRRVAGDTTFTRIAVLTDITATEYTDFCTTSRVTYEYSVRWRVTAGAAQVTSPDTDPPVFAQVEFDFLFLHLERDTSFFVRLDTYRADKRRLRDQRQLAVWGRERPTLAIGEQIWHQLRIPGLQQLLSDRAGVWERLLDLMDQEREQASVVCVRFGRASERYFCNFVQETQRQAQKSYTPDVTLVEVHFVEAV